tara:strand:+ start:706 stop:3321 length:2616 start_codon:yes stop_codon:yes gene_type:complete
LQYPHAPLLRALPPPPPPPVREAEGFGGDVPSKRDFDECLFDLPEDWEKEKQERQQPLLDGVIGIGSGIGFIGSGIGFGSAPAQPPTRISPPGSPIHIRPGFSPLLGAGPLSGISAPSSHESPAAACNSEVKQSPLGGVRPTGSARRGRLGWGQGLAARGLAKPLPSPGESAASLFRTPSQATLGGQDGEGGAAQERSAAADADAAEVGGALAGAAKTAVGEASLSPASEASPHKPSAKYCAPAIAARGWESRLSGSAGEAATAPMKTEALLSLALTPSANCEAFPDSADGSTLATPPSSRRGDLVSSSAVAPQAASAAAPSPVTPQLSREELLLQIDDLESQIESKEKEAEDAESKRAAAARAKVARATAALRHAAANSVDPLGDSDVAKLMRDMYALNQQAAEQTHALLLARLGLAEVKAHVVLPTEQPAYKRNLDQREERARVLLPLVATRVREGRQRARALDAQRQKLQDAWEGSLARREREKDARLAKKPIPAPGEGLEKKSDSGRTPLSSSRSRSIGSFDVVRSEEEMNAVLAQLAADEKRAKSDLWIANQCAMVPPREPEPMRSLRPPFRSRNCFIEDVMAAERERKRRNVWSDREETIFFEKFMVYPKNFRKIQSFLEWKTEGHCVQFYYLRKHKLDLKRSLKHGSKRRPAQRPPPVSSVKPRMPPEERDPEAWVTNPFRQGMRARARSFSYKESALSDQARLTPILHISDSIFNTQVLTLIQSSYHSHYDYHSHPTFSSAMFSPITGVRQGWRGGRAYREGCCRGWLCPGSCSNLRAVRSREGARRRAIGRAAHRRQHLEPVVGAGACEACGWRPRVRSQRLEQGRRARRHQDLDAVPQLLLQLQRPTASCGGGGAGCGRQG